MTMTELHSDDWEDRDRTTTWWDPEDIVDLHDDDEERDTESDPGPWDLAG